MFDHNFVCPKCGSDELRMAETSVTVISKVMGIEGGIIDIGESYYENNPGCKTTFFCWECGFEIPATTDEEVITWIEKN
jgi:predicted nucleic-acid-binding Zn-ribbon protein